MSREIVKVESTTDHLSGQIVVTYDYLERKHETRSRWLPGCATPSVEHVDEKQLYCAVEIFRDEKTAARRIAELLAEMRGA